MEEDPSAGPSAGPSKKKPKVYDQKYLSKWETDPKFKGWLSASKKGEYYFFCKACDVDCKGGKSEVERHAQSTKHKKCASSIKSTPTLTEMPFASATKLGKSTKEAEIRLSAFVAEHNLAFNVVDHLVDVVKTACNDSPIAKGITCGRTKAAAIVKNVIEEQSREELCELLRRESFSLLVDVRVH